MTILDINMTHRGATAEIKQVLEQLEQKATLANDSADEAENGPITDLGTIIDALDQRAYGILILLLALPCCVPLIYIIPQIVSVPILLLAGQMALGHQAPFLPNKLRAKSFPIAPLKTSILKAEKYLGWFERLAVKRVQFLTEGIGLRMVGALMLIPAASIMIPLPSTNTVPGIGVAVISVGLIERDGLLVLLGLLIGLAWVFLLVFFGAEALSLAKAFILSRF